MCLPFCSCFGLGEPRTDDYLGPPNKHGVPPPSRGHPAQRDGGNYNGNGGHQYNGNGYPAHGAAAGAEADRKASNDVRRGTVPATGAGAAATRGWHGHAATGTQEKAAYPYAGADGTLKLQQPAAWNGKVAADGHGDGARGGAPHTYSSYGCAQPPAHNREDAADSHYTAATATAHHERY